MAGAVSQPGGSALTLTGMAHTACGAPARVGPTRQGPEAAHLSVTHPVSLSEGQALKRAFRNPCETLLSIQPPVDAK